MKENYHSVARSKELLYWRRSMRAVSVLLLLSMVAPVFRLAPTVDQFLRNRDRMSDPLQRGEVYNAVSDSFYENWDPATATFLVAAADRYDEGSPMGDELLIGAKLWVASWGIDQDYSEIYDAWRDIDEKRSTSQHYENASQAFQAEIEFYNSRKQFYTELVTLNSGTDFIDYLADTDGEIQEWIDNQDVTQELAEFRQLHPEWARVDDVSMTLLLRVVNRPVIVDSYFSSEYEGLANLLTQLETYNPEGESWSKIPVKMHDTVTLLYLAGFYEGMGVSERIAYLKNNFSTLYVTLDEEEWADFQPWLQQQSQAFQSVAYRVAFFNQYSWLTSEFNRERSIPLVAAMHELENKYPDLPAAVISEIFSYGAMDYNITGVPPFEIFADQYMAWQQAWPEESVEPVDIISAIYLLHQSSREFKVEPDQVTEVVVQLHPAMLADYGVSEYLYGIDFRVPGDAAGPKDFPQAILDFQEDILQFSQDRQLDPVAVRNTYLGLSSTVSVITDTSFVSWSYSIDDTEKYLGEYLDVYQDDFVSAHEAMMFYMVSCDFVRYRGYESPAAVHQRVMEQTSHLRNDLRLLDLAVYGSILEPKIMLEVLKNSTGRVYVADFLDLPSEGVVIYRKTEILQEESLVAEIDPSTITYATEPFTIDTVLPPNSVSIPMVWSYFRDSLEGQKLIEFTAQRSDGQLIQLQNDQTYLNQPAHYAKKVVLVKDTGELEVMPIGTMMAGLEDDGDISAILDQLNAQGVHTAFVPNILYDSTENRIDMNTVESATGFNATLMVLTESGKAYLVHTVLNYIDDPQVLIDELGKLVADDIQFIFLSDVGYSLFVNYDGETFESGGLNEVSAPLLNVQFK
jgi:hypothetical protein